MKKPLISIILPAKNAENFLRETLDSIHNQSYDLWECICVNDNSTDQTAQVLKEYAVKDARFTALDNSGKGVISALQRGYKQSKGELITRMDADDLMPEYKLSVLSNVLLERGKGHVATGKIKYFNALGDGFLNYERWLNGLVEDENHWAHIYKECVIASPNWMLFREDFDELRAFDSQIYPEDYELVFRMYAAGLKVAGVNQVTLLWRDHALRASRTSELYADNRFLALKLDYWKSQDYIKGDTAVLIGAGKKGKAVARELQRLEIPFKWLTNNPKKIGHDIYGVILKSLESCEFSSGGILLAVSSPPELEELEEELIHNSHVLGKDYWVVV